MTLKDGFAFILFKKEESVGLACKLDGSSLNGLNLRVAPRKEKPPEVAGDVLLNMDMKKFRHEKHPKILDDVEDFLQGFECVGSFSQDKKEPNSIVVPGMLRPRVLLLAYDNDFKVVLLYWTGRKWKLRKARSP